MHTLKLIPSIPILCLVYVFISDSQWTSCCVTCVCINIKNQFTWYIRGHSVFVGWVRDMLACNGSLFLQFMVQDQQNPIMKTMLFVCLWFSFKILLGSRNPVLRFTPVEYLLNVHHVYIWECDFGRFGFVRGANLNFVWIQRLYIRVQAPRDTL